MIHRKVFALDVVAALLIGEASLRSSNDQAGGDASANAIAKPAAAPHRFAVAADVAGAEPQKSADIASRIAHRARGVSRVANLMRLAGTESRPQGADAIQARWSRRGAEEGRRGLDRMATHMANDAMGSFQRGSAARLAQAVSSSRGRGTTVPFHAGRDISPTLPRKFARDIDLTVEDLLGQR